MKLIELFKNGGLHHILAIFAIFVCFGQILNKVCKVLDGKETELHMRWWAGATIYGQDAKELWVVVLSLPLWQGLLSQLMSKV